MSTKTIVTITGIRPDFIRMSEVFKRLDQHFNHVMVHTGQHYDDELSRIFFQDLKIRQPDYTLEMGTNSRNHFEQLAYLCRSIPELFIDKKIKPDLVLFLGDSNSAMVSAPLFKEGYRIGHIEGGMRSYDRRMPEEVNRVICDYVSDFVFVYTPLYKERLVKENKPAENIFVVGNTITEIVRQLKPTSSRTKDYIVADIHRSENLKTPKQFGHILNFLSALGKSRGLPVKLVKFPRAVRMIEDHGLLTDKENIELVGPFGFLRYLELQHSAAFVVSDSGTAQEECPLLGVPVIVPRNATERPESVSAGNSILIGENGTVDQMIAMSNKFLDSYSISEANLAWLGDGQTAENIVNILREKL